MLTADPVAQVAAEAWAAYRMAQRKLHWFLRLRFREEGRPFYDNWHLGYLCELLEAQTERDPATLNLLVNMPPGFLKSETISQTWQAWMIGRRDTDDSSLISASNAQDLADRDSRKTMEIVQSAWFTRVFPEFGLDRQTRQPAPWRKEQMADWETPGGARREAIGVGAKGTGRGARRILCDDILSAMDAVSEVKREAANEWYRRTFSTRLRDQTLGTRTVVMQRLHEQDQTGLLLKLEKSGGERWHHVNLRAEESKRKVYFFREFFYDRPAGETIFPTFLTPEKINVLRVTQRDSFSGQYNQNPVEEQGNLLQYDWIRIDTRRAEEIIQEYRLKPTVILDLANTEKKSQKDDPDFSALGLYARDCMMRLWKLAGWAMQADGELVAKTLCAWHKRYGPIDIASEAGGALNAFLSTLRLVQQTEHVSFGVRPLSYSGDKISRADSLRVMARTGFFHMPAEVGAASDLMRIQWNGFPKATHDDIVDIDAYAALEFPNMLAPEPVPVIEPIPAAGILTGDHLLKEIERIRKARLRKNARTR